MEIKKELIGKFFKFERTWDVTKDLPEGSVDEYRYDCPNFICRLMYYKSREWEEAHWSLEALKLDYPYRNFKADWVKDVDDLCNCLKPFYEAENLINNLVNEILEN